MLFLLYRLDENRYALDVRLVAEVLPWVSVTPVTGSPPEVAGVLNYRGAPVPVLDLSQLIVQRPAHRRLSTRVVVVHCPDERGAAHFLGLIVEGATETMRIEDGHFNSIGVNNKAGRHLGPVAMDDRGFVQRTDLDLLLSPKIRRRLFRPSAEA